MNLIDWIVGLLFQVLLILFSCFAFFFPPLMWQQLVDAKLYELLGDRTAADDEKPSRKKKEKPAKVEVSLFTVFPLFAISFYHMAYWLFAILLGYIG